MSLFWLVKHVNLYKILEKIIYEKVGLDNSLFV